jgi:hypothetical protein
MKLYRVSNPGQKTTLSPGVRVVDTTVESFKALIEDLAMRDAAGLLLKPYRGIPEVAGIHPFDLILLDEENLVIALAAAFPTVRLPEAEVPGVNALVLPLRTIASSSTRIGDRLDIAPAGETALPRSAEVARTPQARPVSAISEQKPGIFLRMLRWLFPKRNDLRAPRHAIPDLGAYYWTGGAPQVFPLSDISLTGFYLITEERWTAGTVVLMTLQRTNTSGNDPLDSISILANVVRWGIDGMGFEFVLSDFVSLNPGLSLPGKGTDKLALEQFIKRLHLEHRTQ